MQKIDGPIAKQRSPITIFVSCSAASRNGIKPFLESHLNSNFLFHKIYIQYPWLLVFHTLKGKKVHEIKCNFVDTLTPLLNSQGLGISWWNLNSSYNLHLSCITHLQQAYRFLTINSTESLCIRQHSTTLPVSIVGLRSWNLCHLCAYFCQGGRSWPRHMQMKAIVRFPNLNKHKMFCKNFIIFFHFL